MKFLKSIINLLFYATTLIKKEGFKSTSLKILNYIRNRGLSAFWNSAITNSSNALTAIGTSYKTSQENYFNELKSTSCPSKYFLEYEDRQEVINSYDHKIICFYLPQFHAFKENNEFWGTGFTEWTNVTKSFPLFKGHIQPRFPKDLGYYDLRLKENILKQAQIARNYGIHGFCFHYYWFSGRKVMDTPLNTLFNNKDIDINYCLCWANENWTRRWDGLEQDILLHQMDNEEDYPNFIEEISKYFSDERYIKINGCPVLVIYRAELIKNIELATTIWRERVEKIGYPGLHLIMTESFEDKNSPDSFDAVMDFAPNNYKSSNITSKQIFYHPNFQGHISSYQSVIDYSVNKNKNFPFYHTLCLEWDNSPRKGSTASIFHGCNKDLFENWLAKILKKNPYNNMVFINAWNEWAEGTYLEPDRRNGYAYLQAIYEQLNIADIQRSDLIEKSKQEYRKSRDLALVFHIHYFDCFEFFIKEYAQEIEAFDLFCTVTPNICLEQLNFIKSKVPNTYLIAVDNVGRDVLPFLSLLKTGLLDQYSSCLKLHTKKSLHLKHGIQWRDELYRDLMSIPKYIQLINTSEEDVIIWTNSKNLKTIEDKTSINFKRLLNLTGSIPQNAVFVAGTMFWFNAERLNKLIPKECLKLPFEKEPLPTDGSWAHVMERYIGVKSHSAGFKIKCIEVL